MAHPAPSPLLRLLLIACLVIFGAGNLQAQQKVGINSAVNPDATGAPPGGAARKLVIGEDVVYNEHIATAQQGQTQLLFLDQSAMTVGPNSDLTIDQFVYNPQSGTGAMTVSAARGILRYVGGKLSKQENAVTFRTPSATIAVRGGVMLATIGANGQLEVVFLYGSGLSVTGANGVPVTLRRSGYAIIVSGPGKPPSQPFAVPPNTLAQLLGELDGRVGGTGGSPNPVLNATVADSGLGSTISGNFNGSLQQAGQNQPPPGAPPNVDVGNVQQGNSVNTVQSQGSVPPPPPPPVQIVYAGAFRSTNGNGIANGFVGQSPPAATGYTNGSLQNGTFNVALPSNTGQVTIPVASGSNTFASSGTASPLGPVNGTSYQSADGSFFYANMTPASQPTEREFISGGTPVNSSFAQPTGNTRTYAFAAQQDAALQANIPFVRPQAGGNLSNAAVSPVYVVTPANTAFGDTSTGAAARGLQASLAIDGQAANQQSAISVTAGTFAASQGGQVGFSGQMRGSARLSASATPTAIASGVASIPDANGASLYGGDTISGFVLGQTGTATETPLAGSSSNYGFAQPALPTNVPNGVGASRTTQTLTGYFGGLMATTQQTNPYIVTGTTSIATDAAANAVQATLNGTAQTPSSGVRSLTLQYGGGTAGAFIDDNNFGATESQSNASQVNGQAALSAQLYMVTSGTAPPPASLLPSNTAYCQCQYLQWGYWGGSLTSPASVDSGAPVTRNDVGHLNFWVAGVPTPQADFNTLESQSAIANYSGHAIGSVFENGASYTAVGGVAATYNFGTQSGSFALNNFGGRSFSTTGAAPLQGANYTFSMNNQFATGTVNGSFYGPQAANTGGNFAVQTTVGPPYLASGIFAASQVK